MFNHGLPRGRAFWSFLLTIDQDIAEQTRKAGCTCGGRLHSANYPRKPRGCPGGLPDEYQTRLSFCCDRDGCRKRATPRSVRFLGRKVYLGAVVLLLAAMQQGATRRRVSELSSELGVDRTTLARWQDFWRELFPRTTFWALARARLVPVYEMVDYPLSIVEAFLGPGRLDDWPAWGNLLNFLSPITTTKGLVIKNSLEPRRPAEDAHRRFRSR